MGHERAAPVRRDREAIGERAGRDPAHDPAVLEVHDHQLGGAVDGDERALAPGQHGDAAWVRADGHRGIDAPGGDVDPGQRPVGRAARDVCAAAARGERHGVGLGTDFAAFDLSRVQVCERQPGPIPEAGRNEGETAARRDRDVDGAPPTSIERPRARRRAPCAVTVPAAMSAVQIVRPSGSPQERRPGCLRDRAGTGCSALSALALSGPATTPAKPSAVAPPRNARRVPAPYGAALATISFCSPLTLLLPPRSGVR